jgi:hypothetical protein
MLSLGFLEDIVKSSMVRCNSLEYVILLFFYYGSLIVYLVVVYKYKSILVISVVF